MASKGSRLDCLFFVERVSPSLKYPLFAKRGSLNEVLHNTVRNQERVKPIKQRVDKILIRYRWELILEELIHRQLRFLK